MSDKQIEIIANLIADKFAACQDMNEVEKAIKQVRELVK